MSIDRIRLDAATFSRGQRNLERMSEESKGQNSCRLCSSSATLCRSHILPEMAYANVIDYTSHPRMVAVRDVKSGKISETNRQSGFWERLLCKKCEMKFSRYETYAAKHLLNAKLTPPTGSAHAVTLLKVSDYTRLKLFLLSMLWRIGVATGDFFRGVDLGKHANQLQQMLLTENPGEPDEYGCLITRFIPERDVPIEQILIPPRTSRTHDGHNGCLLAFRGFAFQYYISRHRIPAGVKAAFLNKSGELGIFWMRMGEIPPLKDSWNRCVAAIRREAKSKSN